MIAKQESVKQTARTRRLAILAAMGLVAGCQSPGYKSVGQPKMLVQTNAPVPAVSDEPQSTHAIKQEFAELATVAYNNDAFVDDAPASLREAIAMDDSQPFPASPVVVDALPSGLSLESIESIALGSHPAIAEARARVDSTRGQYVQAGLPFNPTIQYLSEQIGNSDSSGQHSVQMSQQFITANKLGLAQQVELRQIQKQQAQLRIAELRVLTHVRAAFAAAIVSQRRLEIANQIVGLADKSVASVNELFEAEEVSKIEVLQAKVEAEQARITAENSATQLDANLRFLAAAAGIPSLSTQTLAGDIAANLSDAPWEVLISELSSTSPEVTAAGSELERARWSLQLACAQVTPNITGMVAVGVDTATDDSYATIGVSLPLPIRNRNQGNIRSARADIAAASAAIDRTQLSLDGRLAEAVGRYRIARERYERLNTNVIPSAEETFELSRKAFEAGETGYLQLLTAQRTLFNTRLSVLDALAQAKAAMAEIDGLLVTLTP